MAGFTFRPEQAHELARAFTQAQPTMVLDNVTVTEPKWSREVKEPVYDYLAPLLNEYRASWAILRQWATTTSSPT